MKNRLTSLSKLCASELSVLILSVMNKLLICQAEPAAPKLENVAPLIKDPPYMHPTTDNSTEQPQN